MPKLPPTLLEPDRPSNLLNTAQWLAGEGAGSWFQIVTATEGFTIERYSPSGQLECTGTFTASEALSLDQSYRFDFPSHCAKVTLVQNDQRITLVRNE